MPRNLAKASYTPATSTPACYLPRQFSGYRISPPISPQGPEPRVVAERRSEGWILEMESRLGNIRPVLTSSRASEP
ncbi:hypothetical protein HBH98_106390 [Parastagonospora nodorum]|nr:hypothetical protein HBH53_073400 [Parastagonospora nodorum]KAH4046468.1 hypothetical protein HBH49_183800 [Parastagonospora nodorum]KAH4104280.1 hypothetical protein HBH46_099560 [Parastagonospora nodorum]KAH4161974.1 hypothetical protein HBH43_167150 [Parastagonospora nodorum]KAH4186137.1 hypothetical protein HBH42_172300 [Parastagonospora nodorum]